MVRTVHEILSLFVAAFLEWRKDQAQRLGATIAFYGIFSIGPLAIVMFTALSYLIEPQDLSRALLSQIGAQVGDSGANVLASVIEETRGRSVSPLWSVISGAFIVFAASTMFAEIKWALDQIWHAEPEADHGLLSFFKARVLSMSVVVGFSIVIWGVLIGSTVALSASTLLVEAIPRVGDGGYRALELGLAFFGATVLLMMIYKVLPNVALRWRDVVIGAVTTATLFLATRELFSLWLSHVDRSAFGASGAFIGLILWVYFTSMVLLYGAEVTKVYARRFGTYSGDAPLRPYRRRFTKAIGDWVRGKRKRRGALDSTPRETSSD